MLFKYVASWIYPRIPTYSHRKKSSFYAARSHDGPASACIATECDGNCAKYIIAAFPSHPAMRSNVITRARAHFLFMTVFSLKMRLRVLLVYIGVSECLCSLSTLLRGYIHEYLHTHIIVLSRTPFRIKTMVAGKRASFMLLVSTTGQHRHA